MFPVHHQAMAPSVEAGRQNPMPENHPPVTVAGDAPVGQNLWTPKVGDPVRVGRQQLVFGDRLLEFEDSSGLLEQPEQLTQRRSTNLCPAVFSDTIWDVV